MAHFDKDTLIDCIRHNMAMLDESGITSSVLGPPRRFQGKIVRLKFGGRRAPPGGLPLEMCRKSVQQQEGTSGEQFTDDDRSERPFAWVYKLSREPIQQPVQPMRERIRARLLAKLREMEQSGRVNKAALPVAQRPTECTLRFEPKNLEEAGPSNVGQHQSLTARLLAETQLEDETISFAEFARFEAMEGAPGSKRFTIVFPFAEKPRCALPICILRTARIADLIGLACYVYTRAKLEPSCNPPMEYDLYLAEEDLEDFDTELPPQDRMRRVADCGFPTLAMVRRSAVLRRPSQRVLQHQINIFLVDGRCYCLDTESLDISLRQVLEYGLERKRDDEANNAVLNGQNAAFFRRLDYVLEPLDQPGHQFDLNNSVSSSGSTDFVLLRVNSSRSDILQQEHQSRSPGSRYVQSRSMVEFSQLLLEVPSSAGGSKPSTPTSGMAEIDWTKRRTRLNQSQSQQQFSSIDSMATLGRRTGAELAQMMMDQNLLDGGAILEQFKVHRIHRFQPKTLSRLVVRERCFELIPVQPPVPPEEAKKKRSVVTSTNVKMAKTKRVPWELVAAVEVPPNSEQRANARRIVRIISLSGTSPVLNQHIIDTGKAGRPPDGNSAYEGSYWKTFLVEADPDEAWQIGVRLNELLDSRPSQVHLLYHYSAGATLKPPVAAEKAFGTGKSLPKSGGHSPGATSFTREPSIGGEKAPKKKLSMIFSRVRL